MARYKVTVVSSGIGRPVLVVPFQPDALVTAFIDELFKRIARLDLQLQPGTHIATLHLDSETGAILDCEDLLSDVVGEDEKDKLFMVVKEKDAARESNANESQVVDAPRPAEGSVRVRVNTAARAREKAASSAPDFVEVPLSMSLKGLHETIASHLGLRASIDRADMLECNCKLASKLVDDPQVIGQVLVIHGKSEVHRLTVAVPTEIGIQQALRSHFGADLETRKKVVLLGGERDMTTPSLYKTMPVVAICSKQRHVPVHARVDTDDSYHDWTKVLDLHSTEQPIHPACADVSIEESGILETTKSGVLDIFAVVRSTSGASNTKIGKNAIYRARSHWHPAVVQSNRGMAMFLSSLRVYVSLIQDMKHDERAQDANALLFPRIIAYNYRTHVGLVTVRTVPQISMAISHVLENLRRATNDMKANGDTGLFDALALCKTQLVDYGKQYPQPAKRIICISDGEDTKSISNNAATLCWQMREANIAVDSVAPGDEDNDDLRTLSHMLGCYVFEPKSLVNALAICELDPFLSLSERPAIISPAGTPRAMLPFISKFRTIKYSVRPTVVTEDHVPNVKEHQNVNDEFMPLAVAGARPIASTTGSTQSKFRITRLMNEIKALVGAEQERKYDIYASETNMAFWKVVMEGPVGSPYEGGTFLLWLSADDGYPTFAPKARFITKIRHPNISLTGRICMSVFDRDWTSDISMRTLLDMVYGLLLQPEHSDPVNTTITLGYHHDEVEFADQVRAHVKKHARKTREEWRAEILGEVAAPEDDEDVDEDEMDEDEMDEDDKLVDESDLDGDDFL